MASKKQEPMGSLIDGIWGKREEKRALEALVKEIEEDIAEKEAILLERMGKEGLDKSSGKKATVAVAESIVANVVDWEIFTAWARKTNNMHLFHRRVSDPAARELFERDGKIPGLEPFTKRKLNVRTIGEKAK